MNIAVITDQHFGYLKNSPIYWEYFNRFYNDIFFPTLKEYNVKSILDLGDTTDNRKYIEFDTIDSIRTNYYDKLTDYEIHTLVGNHQSFYKDTNKINSPSLLLKDYDNVKVYSNPTTIKIHNLSIDVFPWLNKNNINQLYSVIKNSSSSLAVGHLEFRGGLMHPGSYCEDGFTPNVFNKYKKVLTGHFHFRNVLENIHYIGNPYQLNFGDCGADRGFVILNTDNLELTYINNPYNLFYKIYGYDKDDIDFSIYNKTYVRLYINERDDSIRLDNFVNSLYANGVYEVKINELNELNVKHEYSKSHLNDFSSYSILIEHISQHKNKEYLIKIIDEMFKNIEEKDKYGTY